MDDFEKVLKRLDAAAFARPKRRKHEYPKKRTYKKLGISPGSKGSSWEEHYEGPPSKY